jgi:hypothetical protein
MSKQIFNDVQRGSLARQMGCEGMPQYMPCESTKPGGSLSDQRYNFVQHLVRSILDKAIKDGCPQRAQFFLNYILGRPRSYEAADDQTIQQQQKANRSQEFLKEIPSSILLETLQKHREQQLQEAPLNKPS